MNPLLLAAVITPAVLWMIPPASALPDPGAIVNGGNDLSEVLSEQPEFTDVETFKFTVKLPNKDAFVESGTLILCEKGFKCTATDMTHWSDEIQWSGGDGGTFISDPAAFVDPNFGVGFRIVPETGKVELNDGATYKAKDGAGHTTTWVVHSDKCDVPGQPQVCAIPEPGTSPLLVTGLVAIGWAIRRRPSLRLLRDPISLIAPTPTLTWRPSTEAGQSVRPCVACGAQAAVAGPSAPLG